MFAALCYRAHPLKHSLAESIFVSRVQKTAKKSSLAGSLVSRGITVHLSNEGSVVDEETQWTDTNFQLIFFFDEIDDLQLGNVCVFQLMVDVSSHGVGRTYYR